MHRNKAKRLSAQDKKRLKRRQAIEPIIGHLKSDHRMERCHLKGEIGDRLHAVLCAAGYNIKWLLRMIVKKGITFLEEVFFAPAAGTLTAAVLAGVGLGAASRHCKVVDGRLSSSNHASLDGS